MSASAQRLAMSARPATVVEDLMFIYPSIDNSDRSLVHKDNEWFVRSAHSAAWIPRISGDRI
jgi:hypothetical protein